MYAHTQLVVWLLPLLLVFGCKDDPVIPKDQELITTVQVVFQPQASGTTATWTFTDPDGDGGVAPVITTEPLAPMTSYTASITLTNASVNPSEDITAEVLDEALDHQLFFEVSPGLEMTFEYIDSDSNGMPLGLSTTVTTEELSAGQVTIILVHEPDKSAPGVQQGDRTNAGGETDIEVMFSVEIQ